MWEKLNSFNRKYHMIEPEDHIVIGLSGGADSVCLARYLLFMQDAMNLTLTAVHIHHGIRGAEADRDQEFVRQFCARHQLECVTMRKDVPALAKKLRCSEEEAGRKVRYETFAAIARCRGCSKVAVAHHQNDLAETMLFRMARGTGVVGLSGMLPVSRQYAEDLQVIRPLLALTREEVLEILAACGQEYVEDSTNISMNYTRNYIRYEIVPGLQQLNDQAVRHMYELSEHLWELMDYVEPEMNQVFRRCVILQDGEGRICQEDFLQLKPFVQKNMLHRMLCSVCGHQKDISRVHTESLLGLMHNQPGRKLSMPYGVVACRTEEGLLLKKEAGDKRTDRSMVSRNKPVPANEGAEPDDLRPNPFYQEIILDEIGCASVCLPDGRKMSFQKKQWKGGEVPKSSWIKYLDYGMMRACMVLRTRESGDYIEIDRKGHKKPLRRYFIDEKIPAAQRDSQMLLAGESHIYWVIGGRISDACRITDQTKEVLIVSIDSEKGKDNGDVR